MDLICRLKKRRWFSLFIIILIFRIFLSVIYALIPDSVDQSILTNVTYVTETSAFIVFIVSIFMLFWYRDDECTLQNLIEQKKMFDELAKK